MMKNSVSIETNDIFYCRANEKLSNLYRGTISLILFLRVEKETHFIRFQVESEKNQIRYGISNEFQQFL